MKSMNFAKKSAKKVFFAQVSVKFR